MQRLKLLGTCLTASCLVMATIASAETVKTAPPVDKNAGCRGTKHQSSCRKVAEIRELVGGIQVPPTPAPTTTGQQTSAAGTQQGLQSKVDDSAPPQQPH